MRLRAQQRTGGHLVETAFVFPILFFLMTALIIGSMGIFRYQEVAHLARTAARYASVHGADWAFEHNNGTHLTATDVYNNSIKPNAVLLDLTKLTYTVTYNKSDKQFETAEVNGQIVNTRNVVTVKITYKWVPELYLGSINLTSTSVMPMSY